MRRLQVELPSSRGELGKSLRKCPVRNDVVRDALAGFLPADSARARGLWGGTPTRFA